MKHKHYDMIVAKAENMSLVRFTKLDDGKWVVQADVVQNSTQFCERSEYFLCLPQHNESGQCLHWLNGGAIEVKVHGYWKACGPHAGSSQRWSADGFLMNDNYEYRIKPKKEKRWIVAGYNSLHTMMYFSSYESAAKYKTNGVDAQIIEIEIEVVK